jgi:hypothetical protein
MAIARIFHFLIEIRITRSHDDVDGALGIGLVPSHTRLVGSEGQVGIVKGDLQLVMGLHE